MLIKAIVKCWNCSAPCELPLNDDAQRFFCDRCDVVVLETKKYIGWVYILSNPHQQGVKIGQTKRSPADRAKQLSSTGVAGAFVVEAYFPSYRPERDERKIHEKLRKFQISREHFSLQPLEAIMKIRSALSARDPAYVREAHKQEYQRIVEENKAKIAQNLGRVSSPAVEKHPELLFD